jgi:hypothetical protein
MRPGGLTALSIFNFIFGGLSGLMNLVALATIPMARGQMLENAEKSGQSIDGIPGEGVMYLFAGMAMIRAGLLITSAIGYLQLKRGLGRMLGNIYVVAALCAIVAEIALAPRGFTIASLIDFAYPLITVYLLNVVFRRDFR